MFNNNRLPEIPSDTAETNAIMRLNDNIPALNELTPEKVQNGVQKLVVNYDSSLNELYKKFESGNFISFYISIKNKQTNKHPLFENILCRR